jgi:hypothetical protein
MTAATQFASQLRQTPIAAIGELRAPAKTVYLIAGGETAAKSTKR